MAFALEEIKTPMVNVKGFLQVHMPSVFEILHVAKNRRFEMFPPRITYALPQLHVAIKERFGYKFGTFFEAGANDGLSQSNTAYLERYFGWTGILVEAVPHKYVDCIRNRPKSVVVHAALVSKDYDKDYVRIRYSNLRSTVEAPGVLLDPKAHALEGQRYLGKDRSVAGQIFFAPAKTVSEIVNENQLGKIDLFSLDVEGFELEVLKGIDINRIRPLFFLIEVKPKDISVIETWMRPAGYMLDCQISHHDYLFKDRANRSESVT